MGYFDDLKDGVELTQRMIQYRGRTQMTYWKQLTAGQRTSLVRGMTMQQTGEEKEKVTCMTVDLGDSAERSQRRVLMMLCDESGAPVYAQLKELQAEPNSLVDLLVKTCAAVMEEHEEAK